MTVETELKKTSVESKAGRLILFVCTGNTCRSPMAQALFNHLYNIGDNPDRAESAGLFAYGQPISANAEIALKNVGIADFHHYSRNIDDSLLDKADLIVGMTRSHMTRILMEYPQFASKITSFPKDISDPFGGSLEDYENCLEDIRFGLSEMFGDPQ